MDGFEAGDMSLDVSVLTLWWVTLKPAQCKSGQHWPDIQKGWWCRNVTRLPSVTLISLHKFWRDLEKKQPLLKNFFLYCWQFVVTECMMNICRFLMRWLINARLVNPVFKKRKTHEPCHRQPAEAIGTSVVDSFSGLPVHLMWLISVL